MSMMKLLLTELRFLTTKYHLSGKHKIHELNKMYLINFENSENYDTLNGYIIGQIGRIPKNQEEINIANHKFTILKIKDNFIEKLFFVSWKNNLYIRNPKKSKYDTK